MLLICQHRMQQHWLIMPFKIKTINHLDKIDLSVVFVIKFIDHQPVWDITNENDIEVIRDEYWLISHSLSLSLLLFSDEGMLKPSQLHRVRCLENGCVYQMLAISDLRNHLANHHLKPEYKTTEEKKFNSFAGKRRLFFENVDKQILRWLINFRIYRMEKFFWTK